MAKPVKSIKQLLKNEEINLDTTYRVYQENSGIPLFINHHTKWYENDNYNIVVKEKDFDKLYLIPNHNKIRKQIQEPV